MPEGTELLYVDDRRRRHVIELAEAAQVETGRIRSGGVRQSGKKAVDEATAWTATAWLDDGLRSAAAAVLTAGARIAQETVGYEISSAAPSGGETCPCCYSPNLMHTALSDAGAGIPVPIDEATYSGWSAPTSRLTIAACAPDATSSILALWRTPIASRASRRARFFGRGAGVAVRARQAANPCRTGPMGRPGSLGTGASRKACTYARSWSIRACT